MKPLLRNLLTLTAGAMAGNAALANELCTVDYQETNNWGMGATHQVSVQYNGPGLEQWDLSWTFSGNEKIANLWKGHFEQQGQQVGVIDAGYNGNVASGGQFGTIAGSGPLSAPQRREPAPTAHLLFRV